jgi:hypothetical protein
MPTTGAINALVIATVILFAALAVLVYRAWRDK